ncbi:MAG: D-alanine--D-alanine ligase [Spirochaetes bacterium]|nr:MAG: D-alanine--D-alanine ligase [Spirochaetota bacterium]
MAKVAILYGGRSGEHEVSCTSAAAVLKNLKTEHSAVIIGINREGKWYLQDNPSPIPDVLAIESVSSRKITVIPGECLAFSDGEKLEVDVVIPVLHGSFGEDGRVQGLLETARIPYAGSGVLASAVGMDKDMAKRLWLQAGLPVVPWKTLHAESDSDMSESAAGELFTNLGCPLFVKPANAGSSVGISRVENEAELKSALESAWAFDRKVLVEKAIIGREIECSVMGYSNPKAFPPGEIIPAGKHEFYDYEAKYTDPDGALLKVPADLPETAVLKIQTIAEKAYRCVDAGGLSRVDFLLEGDSGKMYINEINTLPGMTPISLFPRMTAAGGLNFTAMLEKLIQGAIDEYSYRESLSYDN